MKLVLEILFLVFSNADFQFAAEKLTWRSYTVAKALPTTSWVKLIDKREFAKAALDENLKIFIGHVSALDVVESSIDHSYTAQIAALQWDKALTEIPAKYSDYADVFSSDLAMELSENTGMNEYIIKLIEGKQSPYGLIYALSPVELEILKAYIETHLKTGFIQPSKSPAGVPILFDEKPDGSLRLYVNYRGLNNLPIQNWYPLSRISEALDRLGQTKWFT